ncbi:ABC transporter ATP-binding protein [Corynebacterium heidelbergense]|uniref:ABC transporter ATP-binding protein n=1 Tax=Corynebacterium heidelbergense TaxID=2055947 RepID=A0A364VDJ2_9CORY|nr:ABC transporter ATP-binding protein [Corynebacterium heidelbergense]RAV34732.1 ABC transporter ATP-binding protein [Corynebacterium heidelbergense]WCZ37332.1 putative siderophore transport system ATP-binding protein YusV [Corynebacterium heidelbergense]
MAVQGISVENLSVGYGAGAVVEEVTVRAEPGTVTTLLGPNGCGKSTLLKTMSRVLNPMAGSVWVGEDNLHRLKAAAAARRVALLPQHPVCPEGLTVGELVARGRHPHRGLLHRDTAQDRRALCRALELTHTQDLVDHQVQQLSGGQRQRVWMAMVVAQDAPVVLLDEPTTFLDPAHALEVLELTRQLAGEGKTVVMVLHDLMSAAGVSDQIVVLKEGRVFTRGTPEETLTPQVLADVYRLQAEVWAEPRNGGNLVIAPRGFTAD